jgi:Family of unknown function (DUF6069)
VIRAAGIPQRARRLSSTSFAIVSIWWCARSTWGWTHREAVRQTEEIPMTTTLSTTDTQIRTGTTRAPLGRLLLVNVAATVAAGVAAEVWAAAVRATGADLRVGDPFGDPSHTIALPFGACATSIAMCMVLGTVIAALVNWRARRPAYTYAVLATVLTVVSLGAPLVAAGTSATTKFTLIVAHLIAAAVIVPVVARCLARRA